MSNSLIPENPNELIGRRIELTHMGNDPCPMEVGSVGLVERISRWPDGSHLLSVRWEGQTRTLGLVCPPDQFRIVE